MKARRTSKKACNDIAATIGATFYGRDEWDCSGKVYVMHEGRKHSFKRNCDAMEWMLDVAFADLGF